MLVDTHCDRVLALVLLVNDGSHSFTHVNVDADVQFVSIPYSICRIQPTHGHHRRVLVTVQGRIVQ